MRDCSIQRRNQKVIEESAVHRPGARHRGGDQGGRRPPVRRLAGYRSAGTVEFLVEPATQEFFFMEVNARLQVEHPVTEATTGLDLVKLQLHLAQGLGWRASPRRRAATPSRRACAPRTPSRASCRRRVGSPMLRLPTGSGVRVDSGVREGDQISDQFDSMIAKIVAWGQDRDEALARLRRALAQSTVVVEGGTTNRSFLLGAAGPAGDGGGRLRQPLAGPA